MILEDYLLQLAEDAEAAKRLRDDPEQAMTEAGLSEDDKAVMRRGDPAEIRAKLAGVAQPQGGNTVFVVVIMVLPG